MLVAGDKEKHDTLGRRSIGLPKETQVGLFSKKPLRGSSGSSTVPVRLPCDYIVELLRAAGFPTSPENIVATCERVSWMIATQGAFFMEQVNPSQVELFRRRLLDRVKWASEEGPQWLLDEITTSIPQASSAANGLPAKIKAMLLESKDVEGGFFSGPETKRLPRLDDWSS
jgi:hypothetical protein